MDVPLVVGRIIPPKGEARCWRLGRRPSTPRATSSRVVADLPIWLVQPRRYATFRLIRFSPGAGLFSIRIRAPDHPGSRRASSRCLRTVPSTMPRALPASRTEMPTTKQRTAQVLRFGGIRVSSCSTAGTLVVSS